MILPMSRIELAPTSVMAESTAASTSFSPQLTGQELLDHSDLLSLTLGQVQPPAFLVGAHAFLTLLGHLGQDREDVGIGDTGLSIRRRAARCPDP